MSFGSQLGFPISQSRTLRHRQVTTVTWDINTHHLATERVSFSPGLGCSPPPPRGPWKMQGRDSRKHVGPKRSHWVGERVTVEAKSIQNGAPIPDQDSRRLPGGGGQGGWIELARQRRRKGVPTSRV